MPRFRRACCETPISRRRDFSAFAFLSRPDLAPETYPSLSEAMDAFYRDRDAAARIRQKSAGLHRALKTNAERCERKLALQQEALLGSNRYTYRRASCSWRTCIWRRRA